MSFFTAFATGALEETYRRQQEERAQELKREEREEAFEQAQKLEKFKFDLKNEAEELQKKRFFGKGTDYELSWQKGKNDAVFVPAKIGMIGISSDNLIEAFDVLKKDGDKVEVGKVGDYKTIMNPKMFDRLTFDQQQRVDPSRAKKPTDATVDFSEAKAKQTLSVVQEEANVDGKFIKDDPSTVENEAWIEEK